MPKRSAEQALLRGLRKQGFRLRVEGETLYVSPQERLTPIQRDAIRGAKAALVELIEWEESEGPATDSDFRVWFGTIEKGAAARPELRMTCG